MAKVDGVKATNVHKKGDAVRLSATVIDGTVLAKQFVDDDICYHVEFAGADGETHDRWFKESELEGVVI